MDSHTLNLTVEKVLLLPEVSKTVACCRRLVSHFHHSSKSSYLLKTKQEDLHHPTHSLIGDVVTRWNSTFYMIECVLEQQQPFCAALLALKKGDLMPSDTEFAVMETYVQVMKPLVTITEAIGAQKWVTISTVRPLLHKLLNITLTEKDDDTQQQKAMKSAMRMNLQNRCTGELVLLLSKAAFLDPRMKNLAYLSERQRKELIKVINDEAEAEAIIEAESKIEVLDSEKDGCNDKDLSPPPSKKSKEEHKLLEFLGDIINPEDQEVILTAYQKACIEVKRYQDATVTMEETHEGPLCGGNTMQYAFLSLTSWL